MKRKKRSEAFVKIQSFCENSFFFFFFFFFGGGGGGSGWGVRFGGGVRVDVNGK